jgi:hypothetical protein
MATHPQVTGNWTPADGTKSTLEMAKTEDPNLRALRNSFTPEQVLFGTPQQIQSFARSVTEGQLHKMI